MSKQRKTSNVQQRTIDVAEWSRDLWLAGLGALATVEEEGTKLYERLAERRTQAEKDGRKRLEKLQREATRLFDDLVERGRQFEAKGRKELTAGLDAAKDEVAERQQALTGKVERVTGKVEEAAAGAVETVLERLDVPTRTEVKDLAKKVDTLAGKVNALTTLLKERAETPATVVYHLVPHGEGWAVKPEHVETPVFETGTKAEALERGRDLAKAHAPSRLVIHRKDGTMQDQNVYDA